MLTRVAVALWISVAGLAGMSGCDGGQCFGLDYCDCVKQQGCRVETEACFCPVDCETGEPLMCACGGGKYLGCAAADE